MTPELEVGVFDELNEGDQQTPRVWPVDDQSLQQDTGNTGKFTVSG